MNLWRRFKAALPYTTLDKAFHSQWCNEFIALLRERGYDFQTQEMGQGWTEFRYRRYERVGNDRKVTEHRHTVTDQAMLDERPEHWLRFH